MTNPFRRHCWAWLYLAAVIACLPIIFYGAGKAWQRQANGPEHWLPDSHEGTRDFKWFASRMGSDEYVAVSWPGCRLDDPRVPALAAALLEPPAGPDGAQPVQLFRQTIDGTGVFASLTSSPVSLKEDDAKQRMRGWMLAEDGQTTCVLAKLTLAGEDDRHGVIRHLRDAADKVEGLTSEELLIVGPTYDVVAIDNATKATLPRYTLFSWGICIGMLLLWFRSAWLAVQVFAVAFISQNLILAIIHYCGWRLDSVLLLVANLTFALAVAGGVHLVSYVRHGTREGIMRASAVWRGVAAARLPTLLAAGTTCLSMLSLSVSRMPPIQAFGGFAAISVLLAAGLVLTLLPCLMVLFPAAARGPAAGGLWPRVASGVGRARWAILLASLAVLVLGWRGASNLQTTAKLQNLFYHDDPVLQDQRWFEANIGAITPLEVALYWPPQKSELTDDYTLSFRLLERLYLTSRVGNALANMEGIDSTVDASTFLPRLPNSRSRRMRDVVARSVYANEAFKRRDALEETGFYRQRDPEGNELWRVSLRVPADVIDRDGDLVEKIEDRARQIVAEASSPPKVLVCGGVPLIYKTQKVLLEDLFRSFASAVVTIGLVMICVLRRVVLGLLTLIPNLMPMAIVFGVLGWLGSPVEIGAVLTASVALGIAVDDSLHFITRYQRVRNGGTPVGEAVVAAYRECALAMIQTTSALVLSLVVFSLSDFVPVARFAWVICSLLSLALLADLLVLAPILMISEGETLKANGIRPAVLRHRAWR